jgi:hypothetical protein
MLIQIVCPTWHHIGAVSAARLPRKLASHVFDPPPLELPLHASCNVTAEDGNVAPLGSQGSVTKPGYFR